MSLGNTNNGFSSGGGFDSDMNDKTNYDYTPRIEMLNLNALSYTRKSTGQREYGYLAQQVQEVLPEAVYENASKGLAVSYHMVNAAKIQALQYVVSDVKTEQESLKERVKQLENQVLKLGGTL